MTVNLDFDLTPDQWEALKALRQSLSERRTLRRSLVEHLVELRLADLIDEAPVLTSLGRKVLVRGSSSLLDLAA